MNHFCNLFLYLVLQMEVILSQVFFRLYNLGLLSVVGIHVRNSINPVYNIYINRMN